MRQVLGQRVAVPRCNGQANGKTVSRLFAMDDGSRFVGPSGKWNCGQWGEKGGEN